MEALTVVDICRRAGIDAVTVSVTGHKQVMGSHNIAVHADEVYDNIEFEKMDAIVLPGGLPGAVNLHEHEGVNIQVKELFETGRLIGAICAAPGAVLAPAGVLKGRRATVYPGFETGEDIEWTGETVVRSGNIITGHIHAKGRHIQTCCHYATNATMKSMKDLEMKRKSSSIEYSCEMKSHFRKSGNQMSGKWKSSYTSLLA